MHARLQDRPTYVVREEIGQGAMNTLKEEPPIQDRVEQD
jgi:hypothetical protein